MRLCKSLDTMDAVDFELCLNVEEQVSDILKRKPPCWPFYCLFKSLIKAYISLIFFSFGLIGSHIAP